ncbi:MAG: acyl carrier protein [Desulfuromonadales bacterium]|nr:acyl carrier protein [Desulfuromonadales bacterium]
MTEAEIRTHIFRGLALVAPEADFDELPVGENLREELDIDSYDFLSFLIWLNEELGVEIPESDYEKLITLEDLVAYLFQRLN